MLFDTYDDDEESGHPDYWYRRVLFYFLNKYYIFNLFIFMNALKHNTIQILQMDKSTGRLQYQVPASRIEPVQNWKAIELMAKHFG